MSFLFDVTGPSEPLNFVVRVDPGNPRKLLLSWNEPAIFNTMLNYEIHQSIDAGPFERSLVGGTTKKLNITANSPGSRYSFKIRARDLNGFGPFANVRSVVSIDGKLLHSYPRNFFLLNSAIDI